MTLIRSNAYRGTTTRARRLGPGDNQVRLPSAFFAKIEEPGRFRQHSAVAWPKDDTLTITKPRTKIPPDKYRTTCSNYGGGQAFYCLPSVDSVEVLELLYFSAIARSNSSRSFSWCWYFSSTSGLMLLSFFRVSLVLVAKDQSMSFGAYMIRGLKRK